MMEFFDFELADFALFLFEVWIWYLAITFILRYVSNLTTEENKRQYTKITNMIQMVKIEQHDGIDYWYNKNDGAFIAQGKTFNDIVKILQAQYPEKVFILNGLGGLSARTDWKIVDMSILGKMKYDI